jgi:nuclear receptor subfamily 2 group E member 1
LNLVEQAWQDLFLLTAIEQQFTVNTIEFPVEQIYKSDLNYFQEILDRSKQMQIDATELICLKSLALFKVNINDDTIGLDQQYTIVSLHEQAQLFLRTYIHKQYPNEYHRSSQLLTILSSCRCMSSLTLEEIFFRKTIGDQIQMKQLVKDMFKMIVNA